jgi:hypothetical protein
MKRLCQRRAVRLCLLAQRCRRCRRCRLRAHRQRRWVRESDRLQLAARSAGAQAGARIEGECVRGGRAVCQCHNMQVIFVPGMQAGLAGGHSLPAVTGPGQLIGRPLPPTPRRASRFRGPLPHLHLHLHLHLHIAHCTAAPLPPTSPRLASPRLHSTPHLHLHCAHPRSFLVCAPLGPL